jgi:predicted hotdog family 3-hydroxylacyl-ACP dehydratase
LGVTSPELLEVRRVEDTLRVRARVPADLVFLEGHFPGQPLLPGFVQVHWVLALARQHLAVSAPPAAIEVLKFRAPLLPRQEFELTIRATPRRLVFEQASSEQPVSSGRFQLDAALPQHEPEPAAWVPAGPDALPLLLPQAGRMRVLERVLCHDPRATLCEARIDPGTPLCQHGAAPTELGIELLAQCMAAHGGLTAPDGRSPRRGFLVGSRRIELRTRTFRSGERLWVRAEHVRGEAGMVAFRCALGTGTLPGSDAEAQARALVRGSLNAFVEPASG